MYFVKNCTEGLKNLMPSLIDLPDTSNMPQNEKEQIQSLYESLYVTEITSEIINMFHNSINRIRISLSER